MLVPLYIIMDGAFIPHLGKKLRDAGYDIADGQLEKEYGRALRCYALQQPETPMKQKVKIPERDTSDISSLPKKKTPSKEPQPQPPKKKTQAAEKHRCERMKRGGEGCTKNAMRSIDEDGTKRWYCGTEKSGCYKSILEQQKKSQHSNIAKTPKSSKPKKTNQQIDTLMDKLSMAQKSTLEFQRIKNAKLGSINLNPKYRFVCNDEKVVFGKLVGDDIARLTPEDIKLLDEKGCPYTEQKIGDDTEEEDKPNSDDTTEEVSESEMS